MDSVSARARIAAGRDLNAFISLTEENGEGPIVAVKDLIRVQGTVTTGGGIILPKRPDSEDAPVITKLRERGCLVIGKTNLHEWAYGATSDNPHYGPVRNPHDLSRVPGGSSGGSAVAVAAKMCDWAIGTDTGGSIRIPAAFCGVVGIKPTIGAISTEGVLPLSRSLDTAGPLAADVSTAGQALEMMGLKRASGAGTERAARLSEYRLGVPAGWVEDLDETIAAAWADVSQQLPEVSFPDRGRMAAAARTITWAEASAVHRAWLAEDAGRYGSDVRVMLERGLTVLAVDYVEALEEVQRLRSEVAAAMVSLDAVILPTVGIVAFPFGKQDLREIVSRFTRPFNATGQPVVSVPIRSSGLPAAVQVVGHFGKDWDVIRIAEAVEKAWSPNR